MNTAIECKSDHLAIQERNALDRLLNRINQYNSSKTGAIFGQRAHKLVSGKDPMGVKLLTCGLLLLHSSIHAGDSTIPVRKIGKTYLISDYEDIEFVRAIDRAEQNAVPTVAHQAESALEIVSTIYSHWAQTIFGVEADDEFTAIMFNAPAIVATWDHHLPNRPLFGDMWGIPANTYAPDYNYWKILEFPPSIFVSDRPENDTKQYVEGVAAELRTDRQTVLDRIAAHERFHRLITVPIAESCFPVTQNWWSEGVTIPYTDIANFQNRDPKYYGEQREKSAAPIINSPDGIDYFGSLSVWLTLSSIEAESVEPVDILQGSNALISKMVRFAQSGRQFEPKDIPCELFPQFTNTAIMTKIDEKRPHILDMLQQGSFVPYGG